MRVFAENLLDQFLNLRDSGRSADQNDFVDVFGGQVGVLQAVQNRALAAFDEGIRQLFKLGAGDVLLQVFRTGGVSGDKRQVDVGALSGGQFALRFFARFLQTLKSHRVFAEVNAVGLHEFVCDVVDKGFVEVVAAEVTVAFGCDNLENAVCNVQNGHIERTAAEVEDANLLLGFFIQAVSQRRCGRFVDDSHDFQASNLTGVFGCLTLSVVEVSGNGNNRFVDFVTEVGFRRFLEFAKNLGGDFRRRVFFAVDFYLDVIVARSDNLVRNHLFFDCNFVLTATHESFNGRDGSLRVGNSLSFGGFADDGFVVVVKRDDAGG